MNIVDLHFIKTNFYACFYFYQLSLYYDYMHRKIWIVQKINKHYTRESLKVIIIKKWTENVRGMHTMRSTCAKCQIILFSKAPNFPAKTNQATFFVCACSFCIRMFAHLFMRLVESAVVPTSLFTSIFASAFCLWRDKRRIKTITHVSTHLIEFTAVATILEFQLKLEDIFGKTINSELKQKNLLNRTRSCG